MSREWRCAPGFADGSLRVPRFGERLAGGVVGSDDGGDMDDLSECFSDPWSRIVESLTEFPAAGRLFRKWGIGIAASAQMAKGRHGGNPYEFDVVLWNREDVVVVEVRSTLNQDKVEHFMEKLGVFTKACPEYTGRRIHGAVAYLKAYEGVEVACQKMGLFVIKATGDKLRILNEGKGVFKPRLF